MIRRWLRSGRRTSTGDLAVEAAPGPPAPETAPGSRTTLADQADPAETEPARAETGPLEGVTNGGNSADDGEARVRKLLASDAVTAATRQVLTARLDALARPLITTGSCLSADQVSTLRAVLDRLVPQGDRSRPVDLVAAIDARLATGRTDGWRYDELPPDASAITRGLSGLDEAAWERHALHFTDLSAARQDAILQLVERGTVPGETWRTLQPERWFAELLAEAAEIFYADPLAQDEIGYVGYADLPSWQALGLDRREDREPAPLRLEPRPAGAHHDD